MLMLNHKDAASDNTSVKFDWKWVTIVFLFACVARNYLTFQPSQLDRRQAIEAVTFLFSERQQERQEQRQKMAMHVATNEQQAKQQHNVDDVTFIVTTNLIPTSPDIMIVNETVKSFYQHLNGLPRSTPLIITVDGLDNKTRQLQENADERWRQYVVNLKEEFHHSYETVLPQPERINLIGNLQEALKLVQTEFVYIIQHDMPFLKDVNHSALIETMKTHPDEIKMVRFNYIRRHADKFNLCDASTRSFVDNATGIELTKHHVWSDNNHLTRTTYYDELWTFLNRSNRFMEHDMRGRAWHNCSYWGTHLYGVDNFDVIGHLDGRFNKGNNQFARKWERWSWCRDDEADALHSNTTGCVRRR